MHPAPLAEAPGLGRVQYTSPLSDGRPRIELLFPLPVWPKPLDTQLYQFLRQEPWHQRDMFFLRCPGAREPRPILSALAWGRLFIARFQVGYGTQAWAWAKMAACIAVQQQEHALLQQVPCLPPCWQVEAIRNTLAPLYDSFTLAPLIPQELFHRNTVKKLRRLGLIDAEDTTGNIMTSPYGWEL